MKPIKVTRVVWLLVASLLPGCTTDETVPTKDAAPKAAGAGAKKVEIGKNVYLEIDGEQRRVLVDAHVCLRKGQLEQFLTRKRTKEHEAILAAEVDARHIHVALQTARAEPGSPVKFLPKYQPARGTVVKVFIEYQDEQQRTRRVPAQQWIRSIKTGKDMPHDWVFAGSLLLPDPLDATKPPFYAANEGDVICLSNFETAMLDLPIMSSQEDNDLFFEAHTDRIPPVETRVTVILEPVPGAANKGKKDKK